ncbi:MAG: long-chain fatty acid--CoA ligase [Nitriliruptorales bacterium]|nr:long-chain fatty acid--CoA ligase [Nitriliruptorales bacterium]
MQEYTSPGEVSVAAERNLTTSLWEHARTTPERPALAHRVGNTFVEVSAKQFADQVRDVAAGLIGLGIQPGARVCVFSSTRMEWTILDYAIWAAGCVTVPIYETSSAEQVEWIVSNSEAVAIICENDALRDVYEGVAERLPGCEHVYVIEDGAIEELKSAGADIPAEQVTGRAEAVTGDDLATIVYTSGTTGRPKGCVIRHHSFVWEVEQVLSIAPFFRAGQSTLLFLPLAHIFARIIQVAAVTAGVTIGYSTGIPHLVEELQLFRPNFLLAVPRVFEKVFNGAQQRAHADGKGAIFDRAAQVAIDHSRAETSGKVPMTLKIQHRLFDKLVYSKLRAAMGGEVTYAVSGGAALGERLGHFFHGIGLLILEGYGLTETTAGATLNRPDAFRIGTVGKPLPGVTIRIADDGEVLIKGKHVFDGYHGDPDATADVIDDGWFRSGDIGALDDDGFLRITGRKKELIVTAGGKNVAPVVLEDRMRAHPLVSQAMVVGDDQPFIAALVTIDPEEFPRWAQEHGKAGKSVADLVDDPDLRDAVQEAVDDANRAVSKAESVRTFRILPVDFEVGDELSNKMSVKRHVVSDKYREVIDDIYAGKKGGPG